MSEAKGPLHRDFYGSADAWRRSRQAAANYFSGHPGLPESLIPVWGSGREAIADWHDGDYLGAIGNGALAVADVFPVGKAMQVGVRTAAYAKKFGPAAGRSAEWKAVRKWMGDQGYVAKGQPVHHLIENNGRIGKRLPDWVKNSPLNTLPLPDAVTHGRIHDRWKDLPRYGIVDRVRYGTPPAVLVAAPVDAGKAGMSWKAQEDRKR